MTCKITLLVVTSNIVSALAHRHFSNSTFSWADTKHVIAFGDSYTYVQGLRGHVNSSFIGDYMNLAFTPEELLTNKIVQNQTATAEGGPNWVEYLTGCGLQPGLTLPLSCDTQLWDFAFGGADISEQYTPRHHNYTIPLVNQTQQFLTYAQPALSHVVNKDHSLVIFWIGINDIGDSKNYPAVISDYPTFYKTLIDILFQSAVASVHDAGGYNKFLFMNLPPLDRTPGNVLLGPELARPNKTMINTWNTILSSHAAAFEKENKGVQAMVFDTNTFLNSVVDDAANYGITNTTGYCKSYDQPDINTHPEEYGCAPLEEYFWFNTGHLTSHVHEIIAKEVETFLVGQ